MAGRRPEMMVSTCSNELKFMSERERSTKPALNGYTNPDFRELRPVDPSDGVPLSRTREVKELSTPPSYPPGLVVVGEPI